MDKIRPRWKEEIMMLVYEQAQEIMWVCHLPDDAKNSWVVWQVAESEQAANQIIDEIRPDAPEGAKNIWNHLLYRLKRGTRVNPFMYGLCMQQTLIVYAVCRRYDEMGGAEIFTDMTFDLRQLSDKIGGILDD